MYNIGDFVIYSSSGVYKIVDVRKETVLGEVRNYYVLSEEGSVSSSAVFVPIGGDTEKTVLSPLMTPDEAEALIARYGSIEPCEWIAETRPRAAAFKRLIESGDKNALISLIKSIELMQKQRLADGKKPFLADEHTRQRSIKLLCSELSCVLNTPADDIKARLGIL